MQRNVMGRNYEKARMCKQMSSSGGHPVGVRPVFLF